MKGFLLGDRVALTVEVLPVRDKRGQHAPIPRGTVGTVCGYARHTLPQVRFGPGYDPVFVAPHMLALVDFPPDGDLFSWDVYARLARLAVERAAR
jgi:hypothetical protein